MSLYPRHKHPLVQQTRVQIPVLPHPFARKKPPEADPVVEVDHDNVVVRPLDDFVAIPVGVGVVAVSYPHHQLGAMAHQGDAEEPTTALNKHPHRQFRLLGGIRRCPDIHKQTIFTLPLRGIRHAVSEAYWPILPGGQRPI